MAVASTERAPRAARATSRVDRIFAAIPVAVVVLIVVVFYAIEAWSRKTPWIFTDELEWSQISRAIEATGHAARRGQPTYFKSVYAYFLAPFWAIHSTETAYSAIKYGNAILMPLAAVPTYFLAKMVVSKRAAFAVAFLSVCIPGMAYATSIEPEVLAYPYYALASWLIVRALTTGRKRDLALAIGAALFSAIVRWPQFGTIPASFVIAAAGLWVTGPRGKAVRRNWSKSDTLGAIVLLVGGLFLFNRVFLQHIQEWQISTQYWKNRMVDLGLRAGLAFVVGMGLLPIIGGFASLHIPERRGQPAYRAFSAYLAASILCISLYTAVKAAYLSTIFATLWEERNMIYLSPLLLIGTAITFEAKRIDWRVVAAISGFVVFLFYVKAFQLGYGYFEAPGFGILTIFNRWGWTVQDLQFLLLVVLAVSLLLLAFRRFTVVALLAVLLTAAWMLASEIQSTHAFDAEANAIRANLPPHLNWVDRATHGQTVTYLGQEITNPDGLLETEFWNRSIDHVDSLDGSAPGPGPSEAPVLVNTSGLLTNVTSDKYVLADDGVVLQAPIVDQWMKVNVGHLVLYHVKGPWKLGDALQQVYSDGWCPSWCSYTYFGPAKRGTLEISLGRTGYNGSAPPGRVRIQVGTILIDSNQEPAFKHVYETRWVTVPNLSSQTIRIPVTNAPVRVELRTPMSNTFHASASDPRNLSAQVAFKFIPAKG
jgi:Dolichyl-phosphate-mannose-protein mannosyltransferase